MSILKVDTIQEKTSGNGVVIPSGQTLDVSAGTLVPSSGQVVQKQTNSVSNGLPNALVTTSATLVAIPNWYVDITPTKSTNLLVWKTSITGGTSTAGSYARFAIYNANTSTQWSNNSYIAQNGYNSNASEWFESPIFHVNTAGTTSAMRLQLYVLITGGANFDNRWATVDDRLIEVMEIEQ